ncbi:MAG TPA: Fe-S cluster assembly protein HesB [Nocardioidaceae bacterium]|jgi:Fe-S cluster assembly iron-binding protein IscA|nr:Fe-S cluster assembly protein HesB [Nocardioidaceae bacterium]
MLTLTENARDLVAQIPAQPMFSTDAGLRISARPDSGYALNVQAEESPRRGDRVFDYDGARVFLGERAVSKVADKMLDARFTDDGRIQFLLTRADLPRAERSGERAEADDQPAEALSAAG